MSGPKGRPCHAAPTRGPRRYGLHATPKAPFRLAPGRSEADLADAVTALAVPLAPAQAAGLTLSRVDGFLALVPIGARA